MFYTRATQKPDLRDKMSYGNECVAISKGSPPWFFHAYFALDCYCHWYGTWSAKSLVFRFSYYLVWIRSYFLPNDSVI